MLLLACRTPAAPQLLSSTLSRLRHYDHSHAPDPYRPTEWLEWRKARRARAEPLTAEEVGAVEMTSQLPYELHQLLPPHLPLLLQTLTVVYSTEAATVLALAPAPAATAASADALLQPLLSNLAPRGLPPPLSQSTLSSLLRLAATLKPGLAAIRPLVAMLSPVSPSLRDDWRELALHWSVHSLDPDLSLTSLRAFALLSSGCDAALLRTLSLSLAGALRDGAVAKSQLLLRLLRTLPAEAEAPLPTNAWVELGAVASCVLACRYEPVLHEAMRLLLHVLRGASPSADEEVPGSGGSGGGSYVPEWEMLPDGSKLRRAVWTAGAGTVADTSSPPDVKGFVSPAANIGRAADGGARGGGDGSGGAGEACGGGAFSAGSSGIAAPSTYRPASTPHLPPVLREIREAYAHVAGRSTALEEYRGSRAEAARLDARLDERIAANLLKVPPPPHHLITRAHARLASPLCALQAVSVGSEVSAACRATALELIETLAVCYADRLPPNNQLTITVLFSHALGVMRGSNGAALAAHRFLERHGSALAERLSDLFKARADEAAESGAGGEPGGSAGAAAKGSAHLSALAALGGGSAGGMPMSPEKRRREALALGEASAAFAESFFEAYALVFSSAENVDFSMRLLRHWLGSASRVAAGGSGRRGARGLRPSPELQRGARALVACLLRMLTGLVRQYAPTECTPAQFTALASHVVSHFHSSDSSVASTAEALLAEMVARAPQGTPPSIFSLVAPSPPQHAGGGTAPPAAAQPAAAPPSSAEPAAEEGAARDGPAWDLPLLPPGQPEGYPSLLACAERLQACALRGDRGLRDGIGRGRSTSPSDESLDSLDPLSDGEGEGEGEGEMEAEARAAGTEVEADQPGPVATPTAHRVERARAWRKAGRATPTNLRERSGSPPTALALYAALPEVLPEEASDFSLACLARRVEEEQEGGDGEGGGHGGAQAEGTPAPATPAPATPGYDLLQRYARDRAESKHPNFGVSTCQPRPPSCGRYGARKRGSRSSSRQSSRGTPGSGSPVEPPPPPPPPGSPPLPPAAVQVGASGSDGGPAASEAGRPAGSAARDQGAAAAAELKDEDDEEALPLSPDFSSAAAHPHALGSSTPASALQSGSDLSMVTLHPLGDEWTEGFADDGEDDDEEEELMVRLH